MVVVRGGIGWLCVSSVPVAVIGLSSVSLNVCSGFVRAQNEVTNKVSSNPERRCEEMTRQVRVKGVRRETVDDDRLALAVWLMAKSAVEAKRTRQAAERKRRREREVRDER